LPNFPEDVKIKVKIVDGIEHGRTDLFPLIEMAEVGAGKVAASVAAALLVDGPLVPGILLVLDDNLSPA
jgi:hypothetical protein